ncbi:unnamed protein product [Pseudo-nitzschia multistriata]|uniref:Methyltransferase type 11 domain-containing protein n=1 Tax=Pseudo-nitzschia multistriata TaxID=183589 RepID=A0A448ZLR6_9STRA|nr:unnamed protein product [Pseudo-nitzschia multistriata]
MIRSESGTDLLLHSSLSVPFHIIDFEVNGIGGGFVVVNHYGDYGLSAARIDIGVLGDDWRDIDSALLYLHSTASLTSTKCTTTGLNLGGAGVLLYFCSRNQFTDSNRKTLLAALVEELKGFTKSNILCLPRNLSNEDLTHMYKKNEIVTMRHDNEGIDNAFVPLAKTKRKGSFAIATESFDYPIPKALITQEENLVAKSAAYSSFGSILTLMKAKEWTSARIVLLGVTHLALELYQLLKRETDTVFLSNPHPSKEDLQSKIPSDAFISWDEAHKSKEEWDIMVFCSQSCPSLDESVISSIRTKAVISVSDDLLPMDEKRREEVLLTLVKRDIFEAADGISDLGEIAKVFSLAGGTTFSFNDAFGMGCRVMEKKLHLHGIVHSEDVTAKRKFHDLMLHALEKDENARLFGLGTVMHQSSDRMTAWLWSRARSMCPSYRAMSSKSATVKPEKVSYLDMGSGNGAAARWICKQGKKIHITCIDVCAKQSYENRNISDEEGLGSQIDVVQGSYERLNSDYSNFFDGCMSQDAFIHAFTKRSAFLEAFRVTKGGGWLLISDLMRGDGKDGNEEMEAFVKDHNITSWATPNECVQLATEAGWSEDKPTAVFSNGASFREENHTMSYL